VFSCPKYLVLFLAAGSLSLPAEAQRNPQIVRQLATVLLRSDRSWDGSKYRAYPKGSPELTILKIDIPAHTALPWHTHPMPNAAYVISGTLHVQTRNGAKEITLTAGDVLPETVGIIHRGWTEESPVQLIVFYAGVKNMPTEEKVQ
jgi:quercetin dioxygenase-like cupin family protein